jgi:hypothetical protein
MGFNSALKGLSNTLPVASSDFPVILLNQSVIFNVIRSWK